MKERPILFSAPMVRALLAGTKTQTRRIVKSQPSSIAFPVCMDNEDPVYWAFGPEHYICPYGMPDDMEGNDRLWVREDHHITLRDPRSVSVRYLSDDTTIPEVTIGAREHTLFIGRKKPEAVTRARFMWRCLSRITLEIVSVRVERLNDITEADALAEGVTINQAEANATGMWDAAARRAYVELWECINGAGSWALNPWVWVVEFRRVTA